jgi:RNA polymerase sigma-70 factor (ECF subfamily)
MQREFERLLNEHRGIVVKLANAYCRAREERDDLVQEISLQLWRAYPSYDRGRRFSTWMYRVALNTAISFARSASTRQRRAVPLDETAAPELVHHPAAHSDDARVAALYRTLRRFDELDRALLVLHLEDRSHREIAEILGISETNVGTKLARLKNRIRREMAVEKETADGPR